MARGMVRLLSRVEPLFITNEDPRKIRPRDVDLGSAGSSSAQGGQGGHALKAQPGKNIVSDGSSQLLHMLLAADLVDELHLSLYPLSVGGGKRLFPEGSPSRFTLVGTKPYPTGVVGLHYTLTRA